MHVPAAQPAAAESWHHAPGADARCHVLHAARLRAAVQMVSARYWAERRVALGLEGLVDTEADPIGVMVRARCDQTHNRVVCMPLHGRAGVAAGVHASATNAATTAACGRTAVRR